MAEPIRLVIWDLDDTFWNGTLTEGGITYNRHNHDTVVALARRGIISSICSKNDRAAVQPVLEREGIWDYFVFPSIDWAAKGPRLAALVEAMQLRPATILFVDDHPMNRQEASFSVPGIQTGDEHVAAGLLANPLLAGKDDHGLSRLQQYRLLERRQSAKAAAGDNHAFLRTSGITVEITHEFEAQIGRAVELINRTNQLNFTKRRLPEDLAAARAELLALVARYDVQAGLVGVADHYGDYGICGLYVLRNAGADKRLLHFCFSCRILNMGVEQWLYHRIGSPALTVVGEVLTDLHADAETPDWIATGTPAARVIQARSIDHVIVHGGCNLAPIEHYFSAAAARVSGEFNVARDGVDIRRDHSVFLDHALRGLGADRQAELDRMGFAAEDSITAMTQPQQGRAAWVLSLWADADHALYRHKATGLLIPFAVTVPGQPADLTKVAVAELPPRLQTPRLVAAIQRLGREYELAGLVAPDAFERTLRTLLARADSGTRVFVIGHNEVNPHAPEGQRKMWWKADANARTRAIVADFASAEFLDMAAFIQGPQEVEVNPNHFHRLVYRRMFEHILARFPAA